MGSGRWLCLPQFRSSPGRHRSLRWQARPVKWPSICMGCAGQESLHFHASSSLFSSCLSCPPFAGRRQTHSDTFAVPASGKSRICGRFPDLPPNAVFCSASDGRGRQNSRTENTMDEQSPGTLPTVRASGDRLGSWKEIATQLGLSEHQAKLRFRAAADIEDEGQRSVFLRVL